MVAVAKKVENRINGIDLDGVQAIVEEVTRDPSKAMLNFRVKSEWKGQTRSETRVESYVFGGEEVRRPFRIVADEPLELLGSNTAPNPQEVLMAGLNACIMVGYVAGASLHGIHLDKLEIETSGDLDLRGFLGFEGVRPGYETIRYTVRIKGNGTPEQFAEIHETVKKTSPNFFNISRPVAIDAKLVVEN